MPVEELDQFEWLAREALWSTAKSPFGMQWDRWQHYRDTRDPQGIPGLVIGGNLGRAKNDIRNAEMFGPTDRPVLLSRAAEHLGKMAGGLIGISAHLRTPQAKWDLPLREHIDMHLQVTDEVLELAAAGVSGVETSLGSDHYYDRLGDIGEWLRMNDVFGSDKHLEHQGITVRYIAATATRTWQEFLGEHDGLALVPGATPRSAGAYIENLREEFEGIIPIIHEAAERRS